MLRGSVPLTQNPSYGEDSSGCPLGPLFSISGVGCQFPHSYNLPSNVRCIVAFVCTTYTCSGRLAYLLAEFSDPFWLSPAELFKKALVASFPFFSLGAVAVAFYLEFRSVFPKALSFSPFSCSTFIIFKSSFHLSKTKNSSKHCTLARNCLQ